MIRFIEALTIPSGKGQGSPFKLQPFQKKFIRNIYEPHTRGKRAVRRAILSIARKNGKTALIAALVLAHLVGPERIMNGEIYSAANDRDQASIVFKFARQIVELEPDLAAEIDIVHSTKTMVGLATGSVYRAVSAEAGTKHGYLPSLVIYDELAQAKSRDLYDVLDTSFGARDEPLFITISTQSNDPNHILSKLIDDGLSGLDPTIVCQLHAAEEGCDLDDEAQWIKANPALGHFRDREDLASAIRKALRLSAEEPKVRNLFLNQRVSPHATLILRAEWQACVGNADIEIGSGVYLGLDLASTIDLCALVMVAADDPARVQPFFWKPVDLLEEHSTRDFGASIRRYLEWRDAGQLFTTPGRSIDPTVIARFIAELNGKYRVRGLAYDRWRIGDLIREFDTVGLNVWEDRSGIRDDQPQTAKAWVSQSRDGMRIVPWGQGFKDMGPAIDALELAIYDRSLRHANHPVLNWNVGNAIANTDPAGNRKLDKDKSKFRIDGAVALAMALGLRSRDRTAKTVDIDTLIA